MAALSRQYVLWQRLPVRVHCDGTVVQESRIGFDLQADTLPIGVPEAVFPLVARIAVSAGTHTIKVGCSNLHQRPELRARIGHYSVIATG